jgi:hypothetical protein
VKLPELKSWEWRQVGYMGISAAVLGALGWLICSLLFGGCATGPGDPVTSGVPNLYQVEPGIWRGGQPTVGGWKYLHDQLGITNEIKLNTDLEASDQPAVDLGITLYWCPIDTLDQLVDGPDPQAITAALQRIGPGTFIHCEHGKDRTGLLVGLYRLTEGTNAAAAWQEMTNHGYHPALLGLTHYWRDAVERQPQP